MIAVRHSVSDDHDRPGVAGKTNGPTLRCVSWDADAVKPGRDLAPSRRWRRHLEGRRLLRALGKRWMSAWRSRSSPRATPNGRAAALSLDWRTERNSGQRSYNRLLEAPGVSKAADAVGSLQPAPWFEGCRGFMTPESPLDVRLLAPDSRASDGPFGRRSLGRLAHRASR